MSSSGGCGCLALVAPCIGATGVRAGVPSHRSHLMDQEKMKPVDDDFLWLESVLWVSFRDLTLLIGRQA